MSLKKPTKLTLEGSLAVFTYISCGQAGPFALFQDGGIDNYAKDGGPGAV